MHYSFERSPAGWSAAGVFLLLLAACGEPKYDNPRLTEPTPAIASVSSGCAATDPPGPGIGNSATREGELFGSIYEDEVRACGEWTVSLVPDDGHPGLTPFDSTLLATSAYPIMWEFWDVNPGASNACSSNGRDDEQHAESHPQERHCVRPGPYIYTGPGRGGIPRVIPVDYLGAISGAVPTYTGPGSFFTLEVAAEEAELGGASFRDLVINTDLGVATYTETPVLEIDASSSPLSASFSNQIAPVGDSSTTFRFVVGASTTSWDANDTADDGVGSRGRLLARLYYRQGTSGAFTPFTRYYDITNGENQWLRRRKFVPQGTCSDSVSFTIGLELLRPDETPDATPQPSSASGAQRTIRVACPATAPTPTAPDSVWTSDASDTSVVVSWISGSQPSGTTVKIEARPKLGSWTSVASGLSLSPGAYGITGLSPETEYDVRVGHVLGASTVWADPVSFETDAAAFSLNSFDVQSCSRTYSLSKWRIRHVLAWSITGSSGGSTWEIAEGSTNNSSSATVVASGTAGTSWESGEYLEYTGPLYSYFWIRYSGLTDWMPLSANALETTLCGGA